MASTNKMVKIFALFCLVEHVSSHASSTSSSSEVDSIEYEYVSRSSSSSSTSSCSSSVEQEKAERRAMALENEWQYEGIPIEFPSVPSRRDLGPDVHETTSNKSSPGGRPFIKPEESNWMVSTTKGPDPPNHRRYRRIFNPDELASIDDHKFMAAILVNNQLWCGGVIIDSETVLTAAHCLQLQYNNRFFREYVRMLTVRVGSDNATAGGEVYRVSQIIFHPNYKPQTLEFNVAVLKLNKNISFERVDPVAERISYSSDKEVPDNKEITFLGWGSVVGVGGDGGNVLLQKVKLPVYNLADCQEVYGRELVTRNNFCAGYITLAKNVCNHDAGGPAVMDGVLIGILSFSAQRCDVTDKPAVFTNVGAMAEWLEDIKKVQCEDALRLSRILRHPREKMVWLYSTLSGYTRTWLIGILSFSAQRCDVTNKPAVFTNVGAMAEWLEDIMKKEM